MRDALIAALEANSKVQDICLIAVAAYFPLCDLPLAGRLLEGQWPVDVGVVLIQQVREPAEEQQFRSSIPRLTRIEDKVSLLVQGQYEENPYPRWIKIAPTLAAQDIIEYLCLRFPLATFERNGMGRGIDVLIAGCRYWAAFN
ncbi:MAG: hypothetical protein WDM70_00100 [Nitrosomonadales bacterium]